MVIDRRLDGWRHSEVPGLGPPGVELASIHDIQE